VRPEGEWTTILSLIFPAAGSRRNHFSAKILKKKVTGMLKTGNYKFFVKISMRHGYLNFFQSWFEDFGVSGPDR
jgi:hypothetical protein